MAEGFCSCCGADLSTHFVPRGPTVSCSQCGTTPGSEDWDRPKPRSSTALRGVALFPLLFFLMVGDYEPQEGKRPLIRFEWIMRLLLVVGPLGFMLFGIARGSWLLAGLAGVLFIYFALVPSAVLLYWAFLEPKRNPASNVGIAGHRDNLRRESTTLHKSPLQEAETYLHGAQANSRIFDVHGAVRDYQNAARLFRERGEERKATLADTLAQEELAARERRLEGRVRRFTAFIQKAQLSGDFWPAQYETRGLLLSTLGHHAEALTDLQIAERGFREHNFADRANWIAARINEEQSAIVQVVTPKG